VSLLSSQEVMGEERVYEEVLRWSGEIGRYSAGRSGWLCAVLWYGTPTHGLVITLRCCHAYLPDSLTLACSSMAMEMVAGSGCTLHSMTAWSFGFFSLSDNYYYNTSIRLLGKDSLARGVVTDTAAARVGWGQCLAFNNNGLKSR